MATTAINSRNPGNILTWEDKRKLCEAWKKTNLSRNAFIKKHSLPHAFHYWCNKLWPGKKLSTNHTKNVSLADSATDNEQWMQVIPTETPKVQCLLPTDKPETIKVALRCNNIDLKVNIPIEQIITFIKELANATTAIR